PSIYNNKNPLDFSLSRVGVQARGSATVPRMNYRNTDESSHFAYRFASRYLSHGEKDEDHVPLVEPETVGRHGPPPVVKVFDNYEREVGYIARIFHRMHDEQQIPWSDMCVTYRSNWMGEKLNDIFAREGVPCQWLGNQKAKKQFKSGEDSIKLMTMHSSKGLEFPVVAVSGVGYMPGKGAEPVAEAKLLYVAMTRSTEKLLLTSHKETEFLEQLRESAIPEKEAVLG
ncbi:MAG: ATP-binding domain-containing protein, partial [Aestuariibacter sp.]|nr:ATP-binding domain-containing protein [Aestuariibacter sp.]